MIIYFFTALCIIKINNYIIVTINLLLEFKKKKNDISIIDYVSNMFKIFKQDNLLSISCCFDKFKNRNRRRIEYKRKCFMVKPGLSTIVDDQNHSLSNNIVVFLFVIYCYFMLYIKKNLMYQKKL